ncbi:MAG: DUF1405 domain-containing protein [Anaerolineae bacterium]|nr:DUF1405 domain-containing protein [Anaerolineae bacterium]MDW8099839.1 DUF1405 domain-containing protein [Anaerolineae bacterium]
MISLYHRFVHWMLSPWIVTAIFIGNMIGAVAGMIYWYGGHFAASPWYLWPFIPDSPGSTFLVLPALALILWKRPGWPLLNAFAAFGVIKYGLWTVAFWSLFWLSGGPFTLENVAMTFTHLVMTGEGLFLLYYARLTRRAAIGLSLWFAFNDWTDYGPLQTRPGLPLGVSIATMMWVAVALTGLLSAVCIWIADRGEQRWMGR